MPAVFDDAVVTFDDAGATFDGSTIQLEEFIFENGPILFESAAFAVVGHPYVMAFDNGFAIADAPGSVTITEQVSIS